MAVEHKALSILFVCTANVCRSPTGHGVFLDFVERAGLSSRFYVDSAGTNAKKDPKPPEPRAQKIATKAGYDLSALISRPIVDADFKVFDYFIAMDQSHVDKIKAAQPADFKGNIALMMSFSDNEEYTDVPDPYYGSTGDFRTAMNLIEEGCIGLLEHLVNEYFPEQATSSKPS